MSLRIGIVILPQHRWAEAAVRWRAAEQMGFDHAWTYDHLAWQDLAEEPWFGTIPTLTAAATVTSRIRLGTWVASPNFRHPVPFAKDVMTLDDVSAGRVILGVGAGGDGWDAGVLGQAALTPGARVERLAAFVSMLDALLTSGETTVEHPPYTAVRARMHPGPVQSPRPPIVVAANGPRAVATAVRLTTRPGDGWATTGPGASQEDEWWAGVRAIVDRMEEACERAGRDPLALDRYIDLDSAPTYSMSSLEASATPSAARASCGSPTWSSTGRDHAPGTSATSRFSRPWPASWTPCATESSRRPAASAEPIGRYARVP